MCVPLITLPKVWRREFLWATFNWEHSFRGINSKLYHDRIKLVKLTDYPGHFPRLLITFPTYNQANSRQHHCVDFNVGCKSLNIKRDTCNIKDETVPTAEKYHGRLSK